MDPNCLAVFAIWFVGSVISGTTGIGGGMLCLPLAALIVPMDTVIPLACLLNIGMDASLALLHFRFCRMRPMLAMLAGAIPGSAAGVAILLVLSAASLQLLVGVFLVGYVGWQVVSRSRDAVQGKESRLVAALAGFFAGLVGSSISLDGPPVAAYADAMGWQPREVLGTLGVFFIIRSAFSCSLQAYAGLYTAEILQYACWGIPACLLGTLCAMPIVKRFSVRTFRVCLLFIIVCGGLSCLVQAAMTISR